MWLVVIIYKCKTLVYAYVNSDSQLKTPKNVYKLLILPIIALPKCQYASE